MNVSDKFVRSLLHVVLEQVRMNLNVTYRDNKDNSVVVSSAMEHAIVRVVVVELNTEKNRNILELSAEPMQDPIKRRDGPKERSHCKKLQRSIPDLFLLFYFYSSFKT